MPTCATCRSGCGCHLNAPGCGHYGCYGRAPATCPGAAAEEARYAALLRIRRAETARTLRCRERWAAAYRAAVALSLPGPLL